MTVAAVRISPLALRAGPWEALPGSIQFNGLRVDGAQVGWTDGTYLFVDVVYSGAQPSQYHTLGSQTPSLNGTTLTITRTWNAPSLASVKAILKQRLDHDATDRWVQVRGANSAGIESALSTGNNNIDAAGTINAAISAYQAVTWP